MELFTQREGILLIVIYAVIIYLATFLFARGHSASKEGFLVGDRGIGSWQGSFSIAASWIWAPALFLGAQKAYEQGLAGVFWFVAPNVGCLILFSFFAVRIRAKMPQGFTLSGFMRETYSKRVQRLYIVQLIGLSTCSFAVQLLAGGSIISALTGLPFIWVTILMAMIALGYSLTSGLKGSVVADYVQMGLILLIGFTLIPWVVVKAGGWQTIHYGLGGISGQYNSLFGSGGKEVFLTFGLSTTIGLLSGPFGDQAFWQRAFSLERGSIKKTFIRGAVIFATVPLMMSLLGFVVAGNGIMVEDTQLTNLQAVITYLPQWTTIPFTIMILCGLVSTLDSCLSAVSSIAGHDLFSDSKKPNNLTNGLLISRIAMLLLCMTALIIANLPHMQIIYLFLFYGTIRATTLLPTVITLLKPNVSEKGVFYGIIASFLVGLPIFAYGNFGHHTAWIVIGSLASVLLSGVFTLALPKDVKGENVQHVKSL